MIVSAGVHTAAVFQGHTLVVAEDVARVTLAALHTHVLTAGRPPHTQAGLGTGAHTQRVGAVGGAGQGCMEGQRQGVITVLFWCKVEYLKMGVYGD